MQQAFDSLSLSEQQQLLQQLEDQYLAIKQQGLALDMSRGKPCSEQLDLAKPLLALDMSGDYKDKTGIDARNYGALDGVAEAKDLFAEILGTSSGNIIVGGNSSLNLMFDTVQRAWVKGLPNSNCPWGRREVVKFLCPVPGYDRHFAVSEYFGIEMIPVEMDENGPLLDEVRALVKSDPAVKGMWCVPVFSNPGGVVYSAEVVTGLASMQTAAEDFLILWDNSYRLHSLNGEAPAIPDILADCEKAGHPNRAVAFTSTSKITFAGAGVSCMAANAELRKSILSGLSIQTIGYDKLNQLRHVRYLKNLNTVKQIMAQHAAILAPKFKLVDDVLHQQLDGADIASWSKPGGGYFISFNARPGTAKRIFNLCADAGVKLTPPGASFPYGDDPRDSNIRLAPSFPPLGELEQACELLCVCAKLAALEQLVKS